MRAVLPLACLLGVALGGCLDDPPAPADQQASGPPAGPASGSEPAGPVGPCPPPERPGEESRSIPECIHQEALRVIEDRMGENRSLTWMTLNRELSQYRPFVCPATLCAPHLTRPHYALSFHLQVPERPQVHWNFTVYLTPTGAPEEDPAVNSDLPRCKTVPEECAFEVGREEALEAAREHWSKEGHSPSHAAFTRFSRPGGAFPFAWAVYGPSDAEGQRVLYVHAGNGEVLGEEKRGHPTP